MHFLPRPTYPRALLLAAVVGATAFAPMIGRGPADAQQQPPPLQSRPDNTPGSTGPGVLGQGTAPMMSKVSPDGWRTSVAWNDGREVQWRSQEAPGCDGSDIELRLQNNSRTSGMTKLRQLAFSCKRGKDTFPAPDREIGVVSPGASGAAQNLICVCKDRGGVTDLISLDVDFSLEGKGEQVTENGCTYSGNFSNGQRTGQGVYSCANGYRAEGLFQNGALDGAGKETQPGGMTYSGEYLAGKYNGRGKLTFSDGSTYDGRFKDGQRNGAGSMTYADRSAYIGDWQADKRIGRGVMTGPKGEWTYDGPWVNDKREGQGKLTFADGSYTYIGGFHNDVREGQAKVSFADGRKFDGAFAGDKQIGKGALVFADGRKIEGDFNNFVPDGHAVETRADGSVFDGQWSNGVLNGKVSVVQANGVHFTGMFANGKRNGIGEETLSNGTIEQCNWIDDVAQKGCKKLKNKGVAIEYRGKQ